MGSHCIQLVVLTWYSMQHLVRTMGSPYLNMMFPFFWYLSKVIHAMRRYPSADAIWMSHTSSSNSTARPQPIANANAKPKKKKKNSYKQKLKPIFEVDEPEVPLFGPPEQDQAIYILEEAE